MHIPDRIKDLINLNTAVKRMGEGTFESHIKLSADDDDEEVYIPDDERIFGVIETSLVNEIKKAGMDGPTFEKAGPRKMLYFEPGKTVSAIVTCGGLCPGLNSVIRAIVMMNYYRYGNPVTLGFKYGYSGLVEDIGHEVVHLTPGMVAPIHKMGGTILGSSRGHQDPKAMVDRMEKLGVNILYTIGGDGTQKGAMRIIEEIERRGLKIAVVGVPKTIDNDINFINKSFGVETAFSEACESIHSAHTEAEAALNGIGIVKLMGRESGFVASNATLATGEANFCLIPELEFELDGPNGVLEAVEKRVMERKHAVLVVAEGAGQKYVTDNTNPKFDASGNAKLGDIGLFIKDKIAEHFKKKGIEYTIRYIDPSYIIRSVAPTPNDSIFCFQLAQMAVHAGMAGRTGMVVGFINSTFIHLPMEIATSKRKKIDLRGPLWQSVLEATGQPVSFK